jgi:hypothetical protein
MKSSTVALVIAFGSGSPHLIDIFHDAYEIGFLEMAMHAGEQDPLRQIYEQRERQLQQENEFGDYVEELLCKPFLNREIQDHGIQWLKSKWKVDQFQKAEQEAVQTIAHYAYQIYEQDRTKIDFFLASQNSQVRIRVFILPLFQSATDFSVKRRSG